MTKASANMQVLSSIKKKYIEVHVNNRFTDQLTQGYKDEGKKVIHVYEVYARL